MGLKRLALRYILRLEVHYYVYDEVFSAYTTPYSIRCALYLPQRMPVKCS